MSEDEAYVRARLNAMPGLCGPLTVILAPVDPAGNYLWDTRVIGSGMGIAAAWADAARRIREAQENA